MRHVETVGSSSDPSLSQAEITGTNCTEGLNTLMVGLSLHTDSAEVSITTTVSLGHFSLEAELKAFQLEEVGGVDIVPPRHWPAVVSLTAHQL